jgi:hypothetical protein
VTALDAAGNESAISNSACLNASLLPVGCLRVEQVGNQLPLLSWSAPNRNLAGYKVYVGPDTALVSLTPIAITALGFTDSGYTGGERRYTVATVDANGVEMPRSIALPAVNARVVAGLPIQRGVMNKLQVQLSNPSPDSVANLRASVSLGLDRDSTQFRDLRSEVLTLAPNETRLVAVVVGGDAKLPGVEIVANEGESVRLTHNETFAVTDGALVVAMATEDFTRGASGRVRLTVENTRPRARPPRQFAAARDAAQAGPQPAGL